MELFDGLQEALQQALAYEQGKIELQEFGYELTYPDCPFSCIHRQTFDECPYSKYCIVRYDAHTGENIGDPTKYTKG